MLLMLSSSITTHLCRCEPTMEAREATCAAVQQQTGATFVPPFNSVLTIAGQGTIGLEFLQQASAAGHACFDVCCCCT